MRQCMSLLRVFLWKNKVISTGISRFINRQLLVWFSSNLSIRKQVVDCTCLYYISKSRQVFILVGRFKINSLYEGKKEICLIDTFIVTYITHMFTDIQIIKKIMD